jgi:sterol desaturase/sphingolipid hydroxylase (fatty acid hydroxylase superfamily)
VRAGRRERGWGRAALTYGTFPIVFGLSMAVGVYGFEHGWSHELLVFGVTAVAGSIIIALERVHPYEPKWNRSHGDVRTDGLHALVTMLGVPELFRALFFTALYAGSAWISTRVGSDLWPTSWPLLAQLVVALLLTELVYYWVHRWQHETDLLWRFHATHHSAPRLYWLNAARFHPLDTLSTYAIQTPALILLGCPEEVLGLYLIFTGVHGLFQHANLDIRLGPLNWIFSMAELHRWHHSKVLEEANTNYGGNIILWDIVFGTRFLPDRDPPREIGIADLPRFPTGYLAQLATPFRWRRVKIESSSDGRREGSI